MTGPDAIHELMSELGLTPVAAGPERLRVLADKINDLFENDFQKLISILYRMDIDENKLRSLLSENQGTDAGILIAQLMIEREVQKIKTREQYRKKDDKQDENEKW